MVLSIGDVLGGHNAAHDRWLRDRAAEAERDGTQDRTVYTEENISFYEHHAQQHSKAAVVGHARVLRRATAYLKEEAQRACARAAAALAGGPPGLAPPPGALPTPHFATADSSES